MNEKDLIANMKKDSQRKIGILIVVDHITRC